MGRLRDALGDVFGRARRPPNAFMWNGRREPFYNRWWLKLNQPDGDAISLQVLVNNPWDSEGRYRNTGVHIFFDRFSARPERNLMSMPGWPLEAFSGETDRFEVRVGDNRFGARAFVGAFRDEDHDVDVRFDLAIEASDGFLLRHAGFDGLSRSRVSNTLWQAPLSSCRVSGTVTIGDEEVVVERAPGYQDTFWGPSVPDRWFWAQCNRFTEDPESSIVVAGGQLELFGAKLPRFLDSESFPILIALRHDGRRTVFNSVLDPTTYAVDAGRIRLETRKRWRRLRLVYTSEVPRATLRAMDWESPDDTVLESKMTLTAPAELKVFRRAFFGSWKLAARLTTTDAAALCGGAKIDRFSEPHPLWSALWKPIAQALYVAAFLLRGLFSRGG